MSVAFSLREKVVTAEKQDEYEGERVHLLSRNDDLLTRSEVAVYLGVSLSRLARGWGPRPLIGYKRPAMYSKEECDRFLLDCRRR